MVRQINAKNGCFRKSYGVLVIQPNPEKIVTVAGKIIESRIK